MSPSLGCYLENQICNKLGISFYGKYFDFFWMMKHELSRWYQSWSLPLPNESEKPGKWWAWYTFPSWCCLGNGAGNGISPVWAMTPPIPQSPLVAEVLSSVFPFPAPLEGFGVYPQQYSVHRSVQLAAVAGSTRWDEASGQWRVLGLHRAVKFRLMAASRSHPCAVTAALCVLVLPLLSLCLPSHCPVPHPGCTQAALECF